MHKTKERKNPVNASLTTTTATATILGIILMIPSLFVAGTGEQGGINAYGQITPPSQLQEQQGGGGQAITLTAQVPPFHFRSLTHGQTNSYRSFQATSS